MTIPKIPLALMALAIFSFGFTLSTALAATGAFMSGETCGDWMGTLTNMSIGVAVLAVMVIAASALVVWSGERRLKASAEDE